MIAFSVVIAVYNKQQYLAKTLQSVLDQTHANFELIIVNDGSTDTSEAIIKSFLGDSKIQYFAQENQGASAARNFGISKAKHDYIALLDADDYWLPNHLEDLAKAIIQFPEQAVFATNSCIIEDSRTLKRQFSVALTKDIQVVDFFKASFIDSIINSSTVAISTAVFKAIGAFNTNLVNSEDTDLWIRIGAQYKVVFCTKESVYINRTTQGLSTQNVALRHKMDFSAYSQIEAENRSAKKFLDLNRFAFAINARQQNNLEEATQLEAQIDTNNLNKKQRFLLKQSPNNLRLLLRFKKWMNKNGLALSAYK